MSSTNFTTVLPQSNAVIILPSMTGAGQTLLASDSGKLIVLPAATAAGTLSLPAAAIGLRYKIVLQATLGFNVAVSATTTNIYGQFNTITTQGATGVINGVHKTANQTVNILAAAVAGDSIELVSDGILWYGSGMSSAATTGFS